MRTIVSLIGIISGWALVSNIIIITLVCLLVSGIISPNWHPAIYVGLGVGAHYLDKVVSPRLVDFFHYVVAKVKR